MPHGHDAVQVYADLVPDTSLDNTPFDPGVKTAEPFVEENTNPDWSYSNLWVFTSTGPLLVNLVAALPKICFFELIALRSFECVVTLEQRTTRHAAPAAVAKVRYSTNPERVLAGNRRHSNSCKPSASFVQASVDAKRHVVNTRPRTPVADFASRGATADRFMSACQRPRCRRS